MDFSKVNKSFWSWRADNWETLIAQTAIMVIFASLIQDSSAIGAVFWRLFFFIALPVNVFLLARQSNTTPKE